MSAATDEHPRAARKKLARRLAILLGIVVILVLGWLEWLPGMWRLHLWAREKRAEMRLDGFAREAPQVPAGTVVFLGSSTFQRFPYDETYAGKPYLDRGMGSETAMNLLMRIEQSMPVARPAGVVLLIGANDTRSEGIPVPCTLVLVSAVIKTFEIKYPGVPLVFLEIMPVLNDTEAVVERVRVLNEGLERVARENGQTFLRTRRMPLVDETGHGVTAMYDEDGQHLNLDGYKVFAKWIADDGGAATAPLRAP